MPDPNSIEPRSFARKTIEYEHAEIHEGNGYDVDLEFTLTGQTPLYFHLKTGAYKIHLKDLFITTDKAEVKTYIYNSPTVVLNNSPTTSTIFNADDNIATSTTLTIYKNSTISADGTIRKVYYNSGSTDIGQTSNGGTNSTQFWEYILKTNTDYLIKIIRIVEDGNTLGVLKIKYYEER